MLTCGLCVALTAGGLFSQLHADFPQLQLKPVAIGQFFSPTTVTHAGDGSGRLFITDQRGKIHILSDGAILPRPFLDVSAKLVTERSGFDERGLLGLAFHPDYGTEGATGEGLFYVYYSAPSPDAPGTSAEPVDHRSIVAEFRVSETDPNVADPGSERVLLTFNQPQFNHNGGQLGFGPQDGLLYISTGDGGSSNDNNAGHTGGDFSQPSGVLGNAQDRTKLLGKLLRIDPFGSSGAGGEYGIPEDNPFVGEGGGVREEIYAYGLRNPWRYSFDVGAGGTSRLFLADVGQGRFEEVNLMTAGGNYGWRRFEGFEDFDATSPSTGPYVEPIASYSRRGQAGETGLLEIGISVTGGYVYRGSAIPGLQGKYVFGDWSTGFGTPNGTLLGLEETSPGEFELSVLDIVGGNPIGRFIPAFGVDEEGEIYVATKTTLAPSAPEPDTGDPSGQLFKIVAVPDPVVIDLDADRDNSIYSELPDNSNGAGDLFAGRIRQNGLRRALVRFNLDSLPAGTEIAAATLSLAVNQTVTGAFDFSLHRLDRNWGEAGSFGTGQGAPAQTGDATWQAAFFDNDLWTAPGADFAPTPSATASVGEVGPYSWSSEQLAVDVQEWLNEPNQNHGWILLGNETTPSAKRFHSRESEMASLRPKLTVEYVPRSVLTRRETWERSHFQIGEFIDPAGDADHDRIPALLEYAWDLDPREPDDLQEHIHVEVDIAGDVATVTFRRDPRAVDLDYAVEISTDLVEWLPVVTSSGGEDPTGPALISESIDPAHPETRLVEAAFAKSLPSVSRRFVRLNVTRP